MTSAILLFALDDLRDRFADAATPGADPRHDTAPFRAFRDALLPALASAGVPGEVRFWWEGSYNGYALALAIAPPACVERLAAAVSAVCPVDSAREGTAPPHARRLARLLAGGGWEAWPEDDGAVYEAPFGAPTGHFGAPGLRRAP